MPKTIERIKREVARRKLTAGEVSLMASLSYWRVYHTLAGHSEHEDVVKQLAKVLGVDGKES